MGEVAGTSSLKNRMKGKVQEEEEESDEEVFDSDDDDETIAKIQRAHFAQAAAMRGRRRSAPKPKPMSQKRKMEAVKSFHNFTKKLKKDTGVAIRSLVGNNILELSDYSSEDGKSESDGLSEEEFVVNPSAVEELNEGNESYIDPETGDIMEAKQDTKNSCKPLLETSTHLSSSPDPTIKQEPEEPEEPEAPKTLSISDIIDEGDLDTKNVEISEIEESELCPEKAEELLGIKQEENSQDFDITEKLKEMGEISVTPINKKEDDMEDSPKDDDQKSDTEEEKKPVNTNAVNVRRNIREVMDEKNLDASTLAAQRQESERLARVQEQQRIIREVQRQIALNRQNKIHQKTLSLLQGGSSLLKKSLPGHKLNLPNNTVLVKVPSNEAKRSALKSGQLELTKLPKATTSGAQKIKSEHKSDRKEVVEIVDSSSGEESSSSSSDSDDCIMLSDSEVPPSPEAEEDPTNSGLHVNDTYNIPDEQGRVLINIGHPDNEEDIFLAPQIARIIKPHQIGGVRFLFDNIIESVERFSTSTGFGCILAHSMGLGKTLQIVCFCDIFLRHTTSKTVLCIMPINTLQNWVAEFNMWLPVDESTSPLSAHGDVRARKFPIYVLNDSHKTLPMRAKVVKDWTTTGGVLMIGYELYRLLCMKKDKKPRKKRKADAKAEAEKERDEKKSEQTPEDAQVSEESKLEKEDGDPSKFEENKDDSKRDPITQDCANDEDKKMLDEMYEALVKPGPDLVICDEGHRIKNAHSNISYALKQMRTKRRIVLTGYPLQNNLLEYWCMVDFVRPNYLGSRTEFCNMFERPIQNGQCIDSTPQDIRLMRYRAHVLHSLLVGFVQRRSHAVLQSTLPQKEEYVLLIRMTPLQRKLYDRFMNEVVRSSSVPNPLKAFAICCKIWNHPDVLYNFLRKRNELSAAIEEDLDLEEIGGITKKGRARRSTAPPRRATNPRGSSKKPAATIQPNTSTASVPPRSDSSMYGNAPFPTNAPYGGPPNSFRPNQSGSYPPYQNYQNPPQGYYPPNQGYNQNYDSNYYQQPPYGNNYQNQYSQNGPENSQGYNQNYWGNGNYYGNPSYYNNPQYQNSQPPQDFRGNPPPEYNNSQPYPTNYNAPSNEQTYPGNTLQPFTNNQEGFNNQQRPQYQGYNNQAGFSEYNDNNTPQGSYPNNDPSQNYSNQQYPPSYAANTSSFGNNSTTYNQYNNPPNYPGYSNNVPQIQNSDSNMPNQTAIKNEPTAAMNFPVEVKLEPNMSHPVQNSSSAPYDTYSNDIKAEPNVSQTVHNPPAMPYGTYSRAVKSEPNAAQPIHNPASAASCGIPPYGYPPNTPSYPEHTEGNTNGSYATAYPNYPPQLETKPPLSSAGSGSPLPSWPITELKTEIDKLKAEEKIEMKSESDGEVKIEDLDTKTIVKDETTKHPVSEPFQDPTPDQKQEKDKAKSDVSEPEDKTQKKGRRGRPKAKGKEKGDKPKPRGRPKAKGSNDRKTSKDKNNDESESEESEKEDKISRAEAIANMKKAEEITYDWATELLKEYIPGIIENSAKMELFFYLLNESIKMGDRLLLFSQSLFTLNLIEDFLEKNYIPGTNCLWERNTNYYRLDGSTHALEREKLINEFNTNPHIHLFLVSTRAGSLGINLVGANRVIVFDASWNPCHDTQAVCRVYRYGQKKPCFVYRFVMDCCLEKKIYDRQINKQGMADRVVDECNPDAVLSMKEITNLCLDNEEKETEIKDLSEHKDRYIDILMQGVIMHHFQLLNKEPFQHESLLVDRKEKKLSSAEKRLAQRGYELEKKAALAPKPTMAYRTVRTADGSLVQRPVASVRPMQHGARWIPADVWRRQGMTAQEMTLPLDVVIPTNSAEKTNIVLKAGQRVMVLKSPKGIYMQLESGKIIAIKTSFKGLGQKGDNKDNGPVGKKVLASRPVANIPGSLKNNSAITITSKTGPRSGFHRVIRPSLMGQNKMGRPMMPGQKISDIRSRLGELRSYSAMRAKSPVPARLLRPNLPGSVSITKIPKDSKKPEVSSENSVPSRSEATSEDDTHVLDSDEDDSSSNNRKGPKPKVSLSSQEMRDTPKSDASDSSNSREKYSESRTPEIESSAEIKPIVLTTDEKLLSEEVLENKNLEVRDKYRLPETSRVEMVESRNAEAVERKINPLKNYRHQRPSGRQSLESSLSQLEKTASVLNKEGMPDFRRNLDDITQSYSPTGEEKPGAKPRKKRSPNKVDGSAEALSSGSGMSHSVSSLLGPAVASPRPRKPQISPPNKAFSTPIDNSNAQSRLSNRPSLEPSVGHPLLAQPLPNHLQNSSAAISMAHPAMMSGGTSTPTMDPSKSQVPSPLATGTGQMFPGNPPPDGQYGQYPGYGMPYGGYPNPAYYGGYGGAYYPPYGAPNPAPHGAPTPPYAGPPPTPSYAPEGYLPPNPQW